MNTESKSEAAKLAKAKADETKRANKAKEALNQQKYDNPKYKPTNPKAKVDKAQNAYKSSIAALFNGPTDKTKVTVIVKNSQQGKEGGATSLINYLVGVGKGSVSYKVAQRAVYTWIATNGNPKASNVHKAPKTWEQAIALWKKTQGK
jgi:hypothetical protein